MKKKEELPTTETRAGNRHRDSLFLLVREEREIRDDDEDEENTSEAMSG